MIIENYLGETEKVSEDERSRLALQLWRREKGVAIAIIILGWLIKVREQVRHKCDFRLTHPPYSSILPLRYTLTQPT
jgi:hypothetical protein